MHGWRSTPIVCSRRFRINASCHSVGSPSDAAAPPTRPCPDGGGCGRVRWAASLCGCAPRRRVRDAATVAQGEAEVDAALERDLGLPSVHCATDALFTHIEEEEVEEVGDAGALLWTPTPAMPMNGGRASEEQMCCDLLPMPLLSALPLASKLLGFHCRLLDINCSTVSTHN